METFEDFENEFDKESNHFSFLILAAESLGYK